MDNPKKYSGTNLQEPNRSSPYPISRLAGPISLVDTARRIEQASRSIDLQAHAQLAVIAEQIQQLQRQAATILERAEKDLQLHRAECGKRRPSAAA